MSKLTYKKEENKSILSKSNNVKKVKTSTYNSLLNVKRRNRTPIKKSQLIGDYFIPLKLDGTFGNVTLHIQNIIAKSQRLGIPPSSLNDGLVILNNVLPSYLDWLIRMMETYQPDDMNLPLADMNIFADNEILDEQSPNRGCSSCNSTFGNCSSGNWCVGSEGTSWNWDPNENKLKFNEKKGVMITFTYNF